MNDIMYNLCIDVISFRLFFFQMLKRKAFRNLSKSQKNRRLNKMCNSTCSNEMYPSSKEIETAADDYENEYQVVSNEMEIESQVLNSNIVQVTEPEMIGRIDVDGPMPSTSIDIDSNLKKELTQWMCRFNISHQATGALLKILNNIKNVSELCDLPLDSRTLLHTPKSIIMLRDVSPGQYFHYGLKNALIDQLRVLDINKISHNVLININIDGLPLAKSSKSQLYPILGQIYPLIAEPFVIGAYHGYNKPKYPNIFLQDFITEYKTLHEEGFQFDDLQFIVTIRAVICDTPARSFVTCTKGFNGYFGCSKCMQEGEYISHRMIFPNLNAELRTDKNFVERKNDDHHNGTSIFEEVNLGMVSQFPLDYMHLVCLGVVKKMLLIFVKGQFKSVKFSVNMIKEISTNLDQISKWIPSEFARKTRRLDEIDRWKATELRLFLLYIGPVVLQNYLPREYMLHFNALHCAIRILCHETDCITNNEYAKDLLIFFVKTSEHLYGKEFMIYNIHNLTHLSNDVAKFGHLDSFSSFPFESFLFSIKKLLKKGEKPLQQLYNRTVERAKCNLSKKKT